MEFRGLNAWSEDADGTPWVRIRESIQCSAEREICVGLRRTDRRLNSRVSTRQPELVSGAPISGKGLGTRQRIPTGNTANGVEKRLKVPRGTESPFLGEFPTLEPPPRVTRHLKSLTSIAAFSTLISSETQQGSSQVSNRVRMSTRGFTGLLWVSRLL
ncbi:hypothetical protein BDV41DRAFT_113389 [Aspergillus transmontanensis]|uniref:Uncharacterized protein n=1 Tax=Aspergillus transmontanensis TaxID=1034304 RepID=A0A5N6W7U7_9EURO|nr:hypothetical protein BDV41DRAFT_113389 [Aspergillus transmontanensis]